MKIYEIAGAGKLNGMTVMRFRDILSEAPLADYQPMGDFTKPGPFRGPDKKLVPHPVNRLKAERFFKQTPYNFRLFFSNISGHGRYSEYGSMNPELVKIIFAEHGEEIVKGHKDAITVVFVGNKGDAKRMLTPWLMAHRFGHAIRAGGRRKRDTSVSWQEAENRLFDKVNQILNDFYNKPGEPGGKLKSELSKEYNALFNAIGTQRSSREGNILRPYEFFYEIFAQYIGTGNITFNPLPVSIGYGQQAWGHPTQVMSLKSAELRDTAKRQYATEMLARDMEIIFNDVLNDAVGKIYIM